MSDQTSDFNNMIEKYMLVHRQVTPAEFEKTIFEMILAAKNFSLGL